MWHGRTSVRQRLRCAQGMQLIVIVTTLTILPVVWGHGRAMLIHRDQHGKLGLNGIPNSKTIATSVDNLFFQGWLHSELNFDYMPLNDPNQGFFTLNSGHAIHLAPLMIETGLSCHRLDDFSFIDPTSSSSDPNEFLRLRTDHTDVLWYISREQTDPNWLGSLKGVFQLVDLGSTNYQPSEPFILRFTNDPLFLTPDIDASSFVDLFDLAGLQRQWLTPNCQIPDWCDQADWNKDGVVDMAEAVYLFEEWLAPE